MHGVQRKARENMHVALEKYFKIGKIGHSSVIMVEITIMNEIKYMNEIQDKLYNKIMYDKNQVQWTMRNEQRSDENTEN